MAVSPKLIRSLMRSRLAQRMSKGRFAKRLDDGVREHVYIPPHEVCGKHHGVNEVLVQMDGSKILSLYASKKAQIFRLVDPADFEGDHRSLSYYLYAKNPDKMFKLIVNGFGYKLCDETLH